MSAKKSAPSTKKSSWNLRTDVPLLLLIGLAAISAPRVVVHDLHLLSLNSGLYTALAVVPLLIYLAIAVLRKNKRPFYDFMVLGMFFGLFLAVTHQLTWDASWGNNPPQIGGNLRDAFAPNTESLILRFFAFNSSIMTGLTLGVILGAIATGVRWVRTRGGDS